MRILPGSERAGRGKQQGRDSDGWVSEHPSAPHPATTGKGSSVGLGVPIGRGSWPPLEAQLQQSWPSSAPALSPEFGLRPIFHQPQHPGDSPSLSTPGSAAFSFFPGTGEASLQDKSSPKAATLGWNSSSTAVAAAEVQTGPVWDRDFHLSPCSRLPGRHQPSFSGFTSELPLR